MQLQDLVKGDCDCSVGKNKVKSYFVGFAQKTIGLLHTLKERQILKCSPDLSSDHVWPRSPEPDLGPGWTCENSKGSWIFKGKPFLIIYQLTLGNHQKLHKTCSKLSLLLISSFFYFLLEKGTSWWHSHPLISTLWHPATLLLLSWHPALLVISPWHPDDPGSRVWKVLT